MIVWIQAAEALWHRESEAAERLEPLDQFVGDRRVVTMDRRGERLHALVRELPERTPYQTFLVVHVVRHRRGAAFDETSTERFERAAPEPVHRLAPGEGRARG